MKYGSEAGLYLRQVFYLLVLSWGVSFSLWGNPQSILHIDSTARFQRITSKDGLSSDKILAILQDQYGFMWFATAHGVTRYDGIRFFHYESHENDTTSLSDNYITSLAEDIYGNIWIGTHNGLNRYERIEDHFIRYPNKTDELKNVSVRALHADGSGALWIETAGGYLTRFDIKKGRWESFKHNPGVAESDFVYWHIFEDSNQDLWLGGRAFCGERFSYRSGNFFPVPTWNENGQALESSFYVETTEGELFSSSTGQIQQWDKEMQRFIPYCKIPMEATCAAKAPDGTIWIGGNAGLLHWDKSKDSFTHLKFIPEDETSLPSDNVYCVYASPDGCIWIGTNKGIGLYSPLINQFHHYKGYDTSALLQDDQDRLWIGTQNNGCYRLNLDNGTIDHLTYRLMTKDITPETFRREREVIRQYIRHEAIYDADGPLSEQLANDYLAYKKTDLRFMFPEENTVSALYKDKTGRVYIGLWNHVGFNVYDPHSKQMKRYALWSKKPDYDYPRLWLGNPFGANWYNGFLEDSRGRFWCTTWEAFGLNLFNREKGKFEFKHYFPNNVPCFPQGKITQIKYDHPRKRYIMMGKDTYFGYYDVEKKRFYKYGEHLPDDYPNVDIIKGYYKYSKAEEFNLPLRFGCNNILLDGKDHLYMADMKNIVCMSLIDKRVTTIYTSDREGPFVWTLGKNCIIGYQQERFFTIDTENHRIKYQYQDIVKQLGNETIKSLQSTTNGDLWIGTDQTLWQLSGEGKLQKIPDLHDITVIQEMKEPELLCVGSREGITFLMQSHNLGKIPFGNSYLPGNEVRDIYPDSTGGIWIATNDGLAFGKKDKIDSVFRHDEKNPNSLIDDNVFTITGGPDGKLWIATFQGTCLLDPKTGLFHDMSIPDNDCLTSRLASCILEDKDGNIWIGTTDKGINVLSIKNDTIAHFWHHTWDANSLPSNKVECLFCDSSGRVWIGTQKGLAIYNKTERNFTRLDNLSGYQIRAIMEDEYHFFWVSTDNGLLLLDAKGRIVRTFNDYHGLQGNEFSRAACQLKNGLMAFGGQYGVNVFKPDHLRAVVPSGKIMLSGLQVKDSFLRTDINALSKLKLHYFQNSFSIDFAAADYHNSNHLKYRYRLVPFDSRWIYTVPPFLTAKYTNLPFGKYDLEIEASNIYGEWDDKSFKLPIYIQTPWFLSWWFISIVLLLLVLSIMVIIRFRERYLLKKNTQLESMVVERTEKLKRMMEDRNKFFNIISHDLKSPFTQLERLSASLLDEAGLQDEAERKLRLQLIARASRQGKVLLDNLQLWALSQQEMIHPVFRQANLKEECERILELLGPDIQKKELILTNHIPTDIEIYTDKNMLAAILRNLIANAIKYSYRKGTIELYVVRESKFWNVCIKDYGIGIPKGRINKIFRTDTKISSLGTEKEEGTGIGLLIVREFIDRLNEEIHVESEEGKGTLFIFSIHKKRRNAKNFFDR